MSELACIWSITAETCKQIIPNCNYCTLFAVCCVSTVHNVLYRFDNTQREGLSNERCSVASSYKFKSGGLHEKHVVATGNVGNRLSVCL